MSKNCIFKASFFENLNRMVPPEEMTRLCQELYEVRWFLNSHYDLKYLLESNIVSFERRQKLLMSLLTQFNFVFSSYTVSVLLLLLKHRWFHKLGYFINVMKLYTAEIADLLLVEVISRFPVDPEELAFYKQSLEKKFNKKVGYVYKAVPSLLGGCKLRWYGGELDISIRRRVSRAQKLIKFGKVKSIC